MLLKIRSGLKWVAAGAAAMLALVLWFRRPKPKLEVISNPAACPTPLPPTQEGVDAELRKLRRIK